MNEKKTNSLLQAASVLLIQDGDYVLQHRDDKPGISDPGKYDIWGGALEEGESPEEGAIRELLEETGVATKTGELAKVADYKAIGSGPESFGKPIHVHIYYLALPSDVHVKCYEGQGAVRLPVGKAINHPKLNNLSLQAIEIYEADVLSSK